MAFPVSASSSAPVVVWFRQDLRLNDNPALVAAAASGRPVIALYILDTADNDWSLGGASRWWLHHSLTKLAAALHKQYDLPLVLRRGQPAQILPALLRESGADTVYWNRIYEPAGIARDTAIRAALKQDGVAVETHNAALLFEPWTVKTKAGGWFKVFSPFWRACLALPSPTPQRAPKSLMPFGQPIKSDMLADWGLLPSKPDWAGGLRETWTPGEAGAAERLQTFIDKNLYRYADSRDRPDLDCTSRLSPHLRFGEIGPRQVWQAVQMAVDRGGTGIAQNAAKFLAELGWREFCHHLLFHFPTLPQQNFREDFDAFPWNPNSAHVKAWQAGRTGYPIVDAGMRQLWQTGWMHNRMRMIAASFLIKHLLQDWRLGEAWFWDTLVDADLANNAGGWQWVAGSGADAAPYFRIFNPIMQGEKFDPKGEYVRRWVPELANLPKKYLHKPWTAPAAVLDQAGIVLGRDYPSPLVDHDTARKAALAAFAALRNDTGEAVGE
ncbi:deoxyribodipyrimidine photo-lyase [Ferrovibrio sp.]|uniref:cryptochrome/photolyase family protein n=1 Tax=Ferrovibrio sp. TaxID=1917215 RepID=UPI000CB63ACE|nr:deoxyribodipyrimidine photo-lyase [Ferrovibrio sp.]PJI38093.1 MAG: deoxyribodipyrimidine photolyase [Ferrovibrio sp.]